MLRKYKAMVTGVPQSSSSSSSSSIIDDINEDEATEGTSPFPDNKIPKRQRELQTWERDSEMTVKQRTKKMLQKNGSVVQLLKADQQKSTCNAQDLYLFDSVFNDIEESDDDELIQYDDTPRENMNLPLGSNNHTRNGSRDRKAISRHTRRV